MEVVIQKGRYIEIPEYISDKLRGSIKSDKKKIDEIEANIFLFWKP